MVCLCSAACFLCTFGKGAVVFIFSVIPAILSTFFMPVYNVYLSLTGVSAQPLDVTGVLMALAVVVLPVYTVCVFIPKYRQKPIKEKSQ